MLRRVMLISQNIRGNVNEILKCPDKISENVAEKIQKDRYLCNMWLVLLWPAGFIKGAAQPGFRCHPRRLEVRAAEHEGPRLAALEQADLGVRGRIGKISAKCCSFSAVSAPIFARKYAFCSIFQDLPDFLAEIFLIWQNFANFAEVAKCLLIFYEKCWFFKPIFC